MRSGSHDKCILVHSPFLIMDKRDTFDPLLRLHCHSKPFSQHISDFMLVHARSFAALAMSYSTTALRFSNGDNHHGVLGVPPTTAAHRPRPPR